MFSIPRHSRPATHPRRLSDSMPLVGWEQGSETLRNLVLARGPTESLMGNTGPFGRALGLTSHSVRAMCVGNQSLHPEQIRKLRAAGLDPAKVLQPFHRKEGLARSEMLRNRSKVDNPVPYGGPDSPRVILDQAVRDLYTSRREAGQDIGAPALAKILGPAEARASGFRVTPDLAGKWNAKHPDRPVAAHDRRAFDARRMAADAPLPAGADAQAVLPAGSPMRSPSPMPGPGPLPMAMPGPMPAAGPSPVLRDVFMGYMPPSP